MPAGLQIFDPSGNAALEVTDSVAKYVGSLSVAASSGSSQTGTIIDDGFLLGTVWWLTTLPPTATLADDDSFTVSVSGNVLTWVAQASCPALTFYYGVI